MHSNRKHLVELIIAGASVLAAGGVAVADDVEKEARSGISVTAVGGVEDFAGHTMRHTSNLNGLWSVHTAVDVQRYVALEAGYIGTASRISSPIGEDAATLLGSTFEAIGRLSPLPDQRLQPYAFFGAAWRHYDVTGADFTTSDAGMNDSDDLLQIPVGAGVAYRYGALVGDARFTFRPSTGAELVLEDDGGYANMNTWGIAGGLGYEF